MHLSSQTANTLAFTVILLSDTLQLSGATLLTGMQMAQKFLFIVISDHERYNTEGISQALLACLDCFFYLWLTRCQLVILRGTAVHNPFSWFEADSVYFSFSLLNAHTQTDTSAILCAGNAKLSQKYAA